MASTNWRCSMCTHINHFNLLQCELCNNQRYNATTERDISTATMTGDNWICPNTVATGPPAPVTTSNIQLPATVDPSRPTTGARSNEEQRGISTISNQGTDVVPQQQRAPQVPVTDEMEIREMQRQLHELETELERKRMEENKKKLQQRLDTVRSELQRYNNTGDIRPPAETPLAETSLLQSSDTSVISSADTVDETHVKIAFRDEEWACRLCTLRNHHLTNECSACRNPRGDESTERVTADTPISENSSEWICSICTLRNPRQVSVCEVCENPRREPTRPTVVNVPHVEFLPDSDDDTSTLSIETSSVASENQDVSQLQWELEDLERRMRMMGGNQNNPRISSIRESMQSRLQNARQQLSSNFRHQPRTSQGQNRDRNSQTNTKSPGVVSKNLRLVLIGATGQGKSSTGNTILGRNEFEANISAVSITRVTKLRSGFRFNRMVSVVDTPGICDTGVDQKYIQNEILKCIGLTAPGPHAVLLIVNIATRFSLENKESVKFFISHFGDELYRYLIVVFTRKDELERKNKTLDEYINQIPGELEEVLSRCNYRHMAINNDGNNTDKDRQVQELFRVIDHMVEQNSNQFFTNDLYAETDRKVQKRMKKLYRELELRRVTEIRAIRLEQVGRVEETYQQLVLERQQVTGRNLNRSELAELRAAANKDGEIRTRALIDEVDDRLRPLMTRSELRRTAQREIEDEKPGTMQKIGRGVLKVLKGLGGAGLGIIASPFVAAGGVLATVASPIIFGATMAHSPGEDSD